MILISAYQSGSARALAPVIRELLSLEEKVLVTAFPFAAKIFADEGIEAETVEDPESVCRHFRPDVRLVLTGTSWLPELEAEIWQRARVAHIPSLALLDNWNEIANRFTSPENAPPYNSTPDKIAVMDEWTLAKMKEDGCESEKLRITGQPALDFCFANRGQENATLRARLGLDSNSKIILFASEAIETFYGEGTPMAHRHPGYNDEIVLENLLLAVEKSGLKDCLVVVKDHPAEAASRSQPVLALHPRVKVTQARGGKGADWARAADAVVGTTSFLLLEAAFMNRPVCSHRPGARGESPLLQANPGLIEKIDTVDGLANWLQGAFGGKMPVRKKKPAASVVCQLILQMIQSPALI